MSLINELEKLVKKSSDKAADIEPYLSDMSLCPSGYADAVVWPESTDEVAAVVKYAYENNVPVIPVSSQPGTHMYGGSIPKQGGIIIDMKNMNKILEIDTKHKFVRFQPGVTWKQMYEALDKEGARMVMPLTALGNRSVLSDHLDRCVITNTVYDYGEVTQSMEVVWGNGEVFRTGSASVNGFEADNTPTHGLYTHSRGVDPSGPGLDFYRLLQGSQGTIGVVTWMSAKIEWKSQIDKVLFAPIDDVDYVNEFLYKVMPRRIGQEIVILNRVDLAAIIAEDDSEIPALCEKLPEWTLVMVLSGLMRRPEEKIAYEEKYLHDVITKTFRDMQLKEALPGFPGLGRKILKALKTPWDGESWKKRSTGSYEDLFFIARPEKANEYINILKEVLKAHTYPHTQVGMYIQPIEHNRACQVEFTFFYDAESEAEKAEIADITYEAGVKLLAAGAQFTRPYGARLVPVIYDRAGNYTSVLKRLKNIFDEKNILNPGTLCF